MPWKETAPMNERVRFCVLYETGGYAMTELCERFGISRKTGYKWWGRYREQGVAGLQERSRAPASCPHRTAAPVAEALLAVRAQHPYWGPKKLCAYLADHQPDLVLPAPSTVGALLARHGWTQPRSRRRKPTHPGSPPLQAAAPNAVWCADFKGEFRTQDGQVCYPLTVTDAYSRYLLTCTLLPSTAHAGAFPIFEQLFATYGLPQAIRTDNGTPFASTAIAGLSALSAGWIPLGIRHQRGRPGHPQDNGRHERLHRTLKAETLRPPAAHPAAQQARFLRFQQEYNHTRPHEALAQRPPAALYVPSARPLPTQVPAPVYPGHFEVRRVWGPGLFRFQNQRVFLTAVLHGQEIGLEEVDEGLWSIYYYDVLLGRLHERDYRVSG